MGYTLKLDIYYLNLKKIKKEVSRRVRNKVQIGYITENEPCLLSDFFDSLSNDTDESYMTIFMTDFINGFNASFKSNDKNTQAISITTEQYRSFNSEDYTVWGIFKGGATGIDYDIFESDNAEIPTGKINRNNVASLYYFYKIWMPKDSNFGILMVQSYTSTGCTSLFKEQLESYFINKRYKVEWSKYIPKNYIEQYLKDGYIRTVKVVYSKRDENSPLNPLFKSFTEASKMTVFDKLRISFDRLINIPNYKNVLTSQIQSVDSEFDESKDAIRLFFVDSAGKRANSMLSDIDNVLPTITLDDSLMDEATQQPNGEALHLFTKDLLNSIKEQISYTPKLI